jgi:drug/metabolite transporter (DMT)-like permease
MLILEKPAFSQIYQARLPLLYAGVLSSGVAYTLQIVGQRGMNPAVASLVMSLESPVSVLAGFMLLKEALSARELGGCVLMACAVILAQIPDKSD